MSSSILPLKSSAMVRTTMLGDRVIEDHPAEVTTRP
jgi:hypothetical protein